MVTGVTDDLALAHQLADLADEITAPRFRARDFTVRRKADGSEVTDVDLEVEETLLDTVRGRVPDDHFLGEEVGHHRSVSRTRTSRTRTWIVDGIDGTSAFCSGRPPWATLVALQEGAEIVIGVISSPALRRRWWAARGRGAWASVPGATGARRDERLAVARSSRDRARAAVAPEPGLLDGWRDASVRGVATAARPPDVAGHGPVLVAHGHIEASVHLWGQPWDHAPFVVLVEDAGGRFTDLWGGRRIHTATAVFSNGSDHERVRRMAATHAPAVPDVG